MTYPRVNLIRKNERRYQGAVSRKFLFISLVLTPVLLIAILSGVKLIQYTSVRKELEASNALWLDQKPRLDLFYAEQNRVKENETMLAMLDAWEASQLQVVELFQDIQDEVPMTVQLTRASLKGDVKREIFTEAAQLKIDFGLSLQGLSHGEAAEATVIELRKGLLGTDTLADVFHSVKLASMRKRKSKDGENIREFTFEGSME